MPLSGVITAVAAVIESVGGVVNVHQYQREIKTDVDFKTVFPGNPLQGWTISRESTQATDRTVNGIQDQHTLVIRGIYAVDDDNASEMQFRNVVEAVRAEFLKTANRNLSGQCFEIDPVSCRVEQYREFSGVLVHYVELVMTVREYPVAIPA